MSLVDAVTTSGENAASSSSGFSSSANPDEDWTKIPDVAERRRIQNRIAQRNYRKKLMRRLEDLERRADELTHPNEHVHSGDQLDVSNDESISAWQADRDGSRSPPLFVNYPYPPPDSAASHLYPTPLSGLGPPDSYEIDPTRVAPPSVMHFEDSTRNILNDTMSYQGNLDFTPTDHVNSAKSSSNSYSSIPQTPTVSTGHIVSGKNAAQADSENSTKEHGTKDQLEGEAQIVSASDDIENTTQLNANFELPTESERTRMNGIEPFPPWWREAEETQHRHKGQEPRRRRETFTPKEAEEARMERGLEDSSVELDLAPNNDVQEDYEDNTNIAFTPKPETYFTCFFCSKHLHSHLFTRQDSLAQHLRSYHKFDSLKTVFPEHDRDLNQSKNPPPVGEETIATSMDGEKRQEISPTSLGNEMHKVATGLKRRAATPLRGDEVDQEVKVRWHEAVHSIFKVPYNVPDTSPRFLPSQSNNDDSLGTPQQGLTAEFEMEERLLHFRDYHGSFSQEKRDEFDEDDSEPSIEELAMQYKRADGTRVHRELSVLEIANSGEEESHNSANTISATIIDYGHDGYDYTNPAPAQSPEKTAELKLMRRAEVERRCLLLDPPLNNNILRHMPSYRATIQDIRPLSELGWSTLKEKLLAEREEAEQKEADDVGRSFFKLIARDHKLPTKQESLEGSKFVNEVRLVEEHKRTIQESEQKEDVISDSQTKRIQGSSQISDQNNGHLESQAATTKQVEGEALPKFSRYDMNTWGLNNDLLARMLLDADGIRVPGRLPDNHVLEASIAMLERNVKAAAKYRAEREALAESNAEEGEQALKADRAKSSERKGSTSAALDQVETASNNGGRSQRSNGSSQKHDHPMPTFQTDTFRNSHYESSHFHSPIFQPIERGPVGVEHKEVTRKDEATGQDREEEDDKLQSARIELNERLRAATAQSQEIHTTLDKDESLEDSEHQLVDYSSVDSEGKDERELPNMADKSIERLKLFQMDFDNNDSFDLADETATSRSFSQEEFKDFADDASYHSDTMSIVSVAESIFSSLSAMAGSSMSSLASSPGATDLLVRLLLDDAIIKALCLEALQRVDIARDRFERNLGRLLKMFAVELRKEAQTKQERHASHFVQLRARNSAHLICNTLELKKTVSTPNDEVELDDDSEDSGSDSSEDIADDLQQLETFIRTSKAFENLQTKLRSFIYPQEIQSLNATKNTVNIHERNVEESEGKSLVIDDNNFLVTDEPSQIIVQLAIERMISHNAEMPSAKDASRNIIMSSAKGLLALLGYGHQWHQVMSSIKDFTLSLVETMMRRYRPPVAQGKSRIEWRCKCGHRIYDDFTELQPGAAERLRQTLNQGSTNVNIGTMSSFKSLGRTLTSGFSSLWSSLSSSSGRSFDDQLPTHEPPKNDVDTCSPPPEIPSPPPIELLYLLLCYSEGTYATRLLQLGLHSLQEMSDRTLFQLLQDNYKDIKGRWISHLSLRTLQSIKFVRFEMYKSELVDVREKNVIPPPGHTDYRYQPAPPEIIPPVGENHLMHLFQHPDHAEDDSVCLDRFPKKLKEKLHCGKGQPTNFGWGLQFVEGWNGKKIWLIAFVLFGIGSLLIGVLWSIFGHSIQNAFAISGYMIAFATVSMGAVQSLLVM